MTPWHSAGTTLAPDILFFLSVLKIIDLKVFLCHHKLTSWVGNDAFRTK